VACGAAAGGLRRGGGWPAARRRDLADLRGGVTWDVVTCGIQVYFCRIQPINKSRKSCL